MVKRTTKHGRRNYQGTEFNRTGNNKNQKISIWDDYKETINKVKPNRNTYHTPWPYWKYRDKWMTAVYL